MLKPFLLLTVLSSCCLLVYLTTLNSGPKSSFLSLIELEKQEFDKYLVDYNKAYSGEEYLYRFKVFRDTLAYIKVANRQGLSYTLGINRFTDMTHEEVKSLYFSDTPKKNVEITQTASVSYPSALDWRAQGAVTPVKNQSPCAASWAFSTTGVVEGSWKIAGHSLVSLSEQQLLDCSGYFGNNGCFGGYVSNSLSYVLQFGLTSEGNYPYTGNPTICNAGRINPPAATITIYNHIQQDSPDALLAAVATSPISIDVQGDSWINYSGGVLNTPCTSTRYNLSALVVGYDLTASQPYYIVKTSWGTGFGSGGYILVAITPGAGSSCIQGQPIQAIS